MVVANLLLGKNLRSSRRQSTVAGIVIFQILINVQGSGCRRNGTRVFVVGKIFIIGRVR
jgi:hypothetical protein